LLADRIALVETLGAALDTHRQALDAVTTARTAAEDAATKAREAFDAATAGGWTTAQLNHAGPHRTQTHPRPQDDTTTGAGDHCSPLCTRCRVDARRLTGLGRRRGRW